MKSKIGSDACRAEVEKCLVPNFVKQYGRTGNKKTFC
jgi:hypothetical protein